jgi:hypothetical protein
MLFYPAAAGGQPLADRSSPRRNMEMHRLRITGIDEAQISGLDYETLV